MPGFVLKERNTPFRTYEFSKPVITIGRRPANDIVLSDPYVSRTHAEVIAGDDGAYEIRDIGGKHPVRVNQTLISRHRLADGDRVEIGGSVLVYYFQEPPAAPPALELLGEDGNWGTTFQELLTLDTRQTISIKKDGLFSKDMAPLQLDHQRLMLLYEFANAVNEHLEDSSQLLDEALNTAFKILDAERGFVALVEEASGELCCEHVRNLSAAGSPAQLGVSRTIVHKVLRDAVSVLILDARADAQFAKAKSIQDLEIRSAMAVPLLVRDKALGLIYVDNRASAGRFDQDDLVFLVALGHLTAVALANANLHRQVVQENIRLLDALKPKYQLIGESEAMVRVFNTIKKAAPTDVTVLLEGETGTGKELAARAIHAMSPRTDMPFIAVNCAAIPKDLIESELFGHERGAFTGAVAAREGKFRAADGGTIFLDEIGDMSLETQSKVLRALEQREVMSVGGSRTQTVDVRVIAASNRDLHQAVADGRFREDLYYRLNVIALKMPPLRERREDILLLAESFLAGRASSISPRARQLLLAYGWPGNVRELKNCVDRALVMGDGDVIRPEDLPVPIRTGGSVIDAPPESLEEVERRHILKVLKSTKWHKSEAARILGIVRQTLDNKIEKHHLEKM